MAKKQQSPQDPDVGVWRDKTSYSQAKGGGRGETPPRVWDLKVCKDLTITVHRYHGVMGTWFLKSRGLDIDYHDLHTDNLEAAKAKACAFVMARLVSNVEALQEILEEETGQKCT